MVTRWQVLIASLTVFLFVAAVVLLFVASVHRIVTG